MVRYANKPDGYVRGLPETSQNTVSVPEDVVKGIIEAEHGEPIVIETFRHGVPNPAFFVYRAIHDNYLNPAYFPWSEGLPLDTTWHPEQDAEIPIVIGDDPPPGPDPDITPPTNPTVLAATAISQSQINLTWGISLDNVGVAGYRVERCTGSGCTGFTLVGSPTTNSFNNTGLATDTTYRYRVRAIDGAGNLSGYSSIVTVTTLDVPPPAPDIIPPTAPATLAATVVSQSQVNLAWSASTDNVAVTGYQVERAIGPGFTTYALVASPVGTTFVNTGLLAGTSYRYRVRARDAAGNFSAYSPIANATTLSAPPGDTTPPSIPTGLNSTVISATQINLTWTASTDNVAVSGYRVERALGASGAFSQITSVSGTSYNNTGLTPNTLYRYRVRAFDAVGNLSLFSAIVSDTTLAGDPDPPDPDVDPSIVNPGFETPNLSGWSHGPGWDDFTVRVRSGARSATNKTLGGIPCFQTKYVPCVQGKRITAKCWVLPYAPESCGAKVALRWYNASKNSIGESTGNQVVSGSVWKQSSVTATAPAGTAYVKFGFISVNGQYETGNLKWPCVDDCTWDYTGIPTSLLTFDAVAAVLDEPSLLVGSPYYLARDHPDFARVGTSYNYKVTFTYLNSVNAPSTWSPPNFDLTAYSTGTWVMVEYHLVSNPEDRLYWAYLVDSGVYPELEEAIDNISLNLFYLPVAILMRDKVWFDDPPGTPLDKTTYRLLKDLTLDAYEVKEDYLEQQAIDDAENDENKSNAEVWDFFIHFGVPIHSHIRGSREYIWHFLRFIETSGQWTTFEQYQTWLTSGGEQPSSWLHVHEGETTGFYALYGWSYVYSVTKPGIYDPPGIAEPLAPRRMFSKVYDFGTADYAEGIYEVHGPGTPIATGESDTEFHDYAVFTRQNPTVDGESSYTQVLIMAPSMFYKVNTSEEGDLRERYVDVKLFSEDPDEIDFVSEFRYPVHIGSLRETSVMHREEMLQDALAATVYLVEEVKQKWYQKGFWTWLIVIIVIIVVVLTYHYELLGQIATLAAAAAGATALGLWTLYVVMVFALGYLISFAGSLIGGTWGKIFVIVASIYLAGGPQAFTNPMSGWSSAANSFTTAPGWGTAFRFISATAPYLNFAMEIYTRNEMHQLESEMRDFIKSAKEKQQELDDAWATLDTPSWIDPLDLAKILSTNGYVETPGNFYDRTLNANPGLLGYDLVNNFTEIALSLPSDLNNGNMIDSMFMDFARQRGAV
jgi:chitodextrinase